MTVLPRAAACLPDSMYISLFPSSRALRLVYMMAALCMTLALLGEAWSIYRSEKAFVAGAVVADVILINGRRETDAVTSDGSTQRKNAQLAYHAPDGETVTVSQDLGDAEIATLKAGGTLHVQYLPAQPQASARLEGHSKATWQLLAWASFLAIYAFALKPAAAPAPSRGRA